MMKLTKFRHRCLFESLNYYKANLFYLSSARHEPGTLAFLNPKLILQSHAEEEFEDGGDYYFSVLTFVDGLWQR